MNNDDINNLLMLKIIKINTHINEMEEIEEDLHRKAGNKRIWAFQWIQNREMEYAGTWSALQEQAKEDEVSFTNFVRMDPATFNKLAEIVRPDIEKLCVYMCKIMCFNINNISHNNIIDVANVIY